MKSVDLPELGGPMRTTVRRADGAWAGGAERGECLFQGGEGGGVSIEEENQGGGGGVIAGYEPELGQGGILDQLVLDVTIQVKEGAGGAPDDDLRHVRCDGSDAGGDDGVEANDGAIAFAPGGEVPPGIGEREVDQLRGATMIVSASETVVGAIDGFAREIDG